MRLRWGLSGLLLWGAATLTAVLLHCQGIRREPVRLALADGTSIYGSLYRAADIDPSTPAPAAVVLHGMAVSHRSCEAALAMPLARSGFVVLAIDLRGHGRSGGSLPASWFQDLDRILELRTEQPEVAAALQYLKTLPDVDANRLCLLGHSLGGLVAANAACSSEDVASVAAISVAPQMCNAERPRNLFLYSGDFDRLIPLERFVSALRNATGGLMEECYTTFGKLHEGTGRQLWLAHWVSHMSPLFDPSASRHAVQWAAFSVSHDPGSVPGGRLVATDYAVLLAVLAGGVACTVFLKRVAERFLPAETGTTGSWGRAAVALAFCFLAAPAAAFLGGCLPVVGVLDAVSTITLFALLALVWMAASWTMESGGWRVLLWHESSASRTGFPARPDGLGSPSYLIIFRATALEGARGAAVGMLCVLLGFAWLGLPFGAIWADLVPNSGRAAVGLTLFALLLPWTFLLTGGIQRTIPAHGKWFGVIRGLAWLAVPLAVWLGSELFDHRHPFFGISVTLAAAAFVLPLPLWLLEDRKGMTMARAVSLAVSAAWIFACHLPFVNGG